MKPSQSIKNWSVDDKPREKMLLNGASSLSNSELLAILIKTGTAKTNAIEIAKQLLHLVDNDLQKLAQLSIDQVLQQKIDGLGQVKLITIFAALELGIRRNMSLVKKPTMTTSSDVAQYLKEKLQHLPHEVFVAIFLNRSNKILHYQTISQGGITATVVDIKLILKQALAHHTQKIVLCHNHPSGSITPSIEDKNITQKIKEAANLLDMAVIDHLIVGMEGYFSFADEGLL